MTPPADDHISLDISGAQVSGPPEVVARIRRVMDAGAAAEAAAPTPATDQGRRPSPRHAGIHELLDLLDAAKAAGTREVEVPDRAGQTIKLRVTPEEEEQLRTTGLSGPPIDTLAKAVDQLLLWREWR